MRSWDGPGCEGFFFTEVKWFARTRKWGRLGCRICPLVTNVSCTSDFLSGPWERDRHLGRLFQVWGRVGILLINIKGAPSRTNHHDEPKVHYCGHFSEGNLGFVISQPVRQVGTLSSLGKNLWRWWWRETHIWERSFLGHSKSQHVSKWSLIYSLKKCVLCMEE